MLFDRRRKQKQEAREYAAEVRSKRKLKAPPRFKLETRVLPTQDGRFEVKAVLLERPSAVHYAEQCWDYAPVRDIETLELFNGSEFLRLYNDVRGRQGGLVGTAPRYENLLAAESMEAALIREFGKAVEVIDRRAQIKPTETAAPLPESTTEVYEEEQAGWMSPEYRLPNRPVIPKHMLLDTQRDPSELARLFADEWERELVKAINKLRWERYDTKPEDYRG